MVIKIKVFILLSVLVCSCAEFQDIFVETKTSRAVEVVKSEHESSLTQAVGQRAPIKTKKGVYYFVAPGDTLGGIAGRQHIKQEELADINDLLESKLVIGRRLFIPAQGLRKKYVMVSNIVGEKGTKKRGGKRLTFDWPVKKFVLTSGFGSRRGRPHDGIDLSAKRGTPIFAAEDGKVIYAKRFSSYGNLIVIKHGGNYFTAYAHTDTVFVHKDGSVKKGQKIATIGRTGRSSGPHLHFETYRGTMAIDPITVLPKRELVTWKKR